MDWMSPDVTPLLVSFSITLLAELGDKTQICTIVLSSRPPAHPTFLGAMAAFLIVDGFSALLGGGLLQTLPRGLIGIAAGVIFMAFGITSLVRKGGSISLCGAAGASGASFFRAFSLIALMELGDKTQFSSILLAARFGSPLLVFAGVMLALATVTGLGVLLGYKVLRVVPEKPLRIGSAAVFIALGLVQMVEALFEMGILP